MFGKDLILSAKYIAIGLLLISCANGLPELNPYSSTTDSPGEYWEPSDKELNESFPTNDPITSHDPTELDTSALTLSQLLDIALANNPTTEQAWQDARAAAAAWAEARGLYYPNIAGVAGYFYETGGGTSRGKDPFDEQYGQFGLSLNYLLLDFGGRSAEIDAARLALLNANWNQNQAIQNVLREVAVAYYTYIGSQALVEADESNLEEAETSLEAADLRLEAGVGTVPDVLQAKATLSQVQLDLVSDKGLVEISKGNLATQVGWPSNTEFEVVDPIEEPPIEALSESVDGLIDLAKNNRPALAAVQANVLRKEALVREAKSELWPELSATAQIVRWFVWPENQSSDFFNNYLVGLQLQVPIFQGFSLINSVRQAESELESAKAALKLQEQIVIDEVWDSYYNFKTAVESLEAARTLLASAAESYEASLTRYRSGVGDIVELLNAQTTLAEARAQEVQSVTEIFISYANLLNAVGTDIESLELNEDSAPKTNGGEN